MSSTTLSKPSVGLSSVRGASAAVVFLGRLLFSLMFLMASFNHFKGQTIAYAASQGVPLASIAVPISGVLALLGGLSILVGYRAKIGAWLIALFLIGVTPMMHKFWAVGDPMIITQFGAGPWSVDNRG
jgi:putative oxidoreductase